MSKYKKTQINAYVIDKAKNDIGDEYIEPEQIPAGSIDRIHNGVWKHLLIRNKGGTICLPTIDPKPISGLLPRDLYDALSDRHSPNVFCNKENSGKKWGIVAMYVIIGVLFFFLFLIWATHTGPQAAALIIPFFLKTEINHVINKKETTKEF